MANKKNVPVQGPLVTKITDADLSSHLGSVAVKNADGTVGVAASSTSALYGIIIDCQSGTSATATIAPAGCGLRVHAWAEGAINENARVTAGTSGGCSAAASASCVIGYADTAASAGGRFWLILGMPPGAYYSS